MTPEEKARQNIDQPLERWKFYDFGETDIFGGPGVAVREFKVDSGYVDYCLYIDGKVAGVIEANKDGHTLTGVESQTTKYVAGIPQGPFNQFGGIGCAYALFGDRLAEFMEELNTRLAA